MRIIETKVYTYDELSDKAKERARDWYREDNLDDTFWCEYVISDFEEVAKACGFCLNTARRGRNEKAIYWSGFSSQGDGASFEGSWRASDVTVTALLADRPASYEDSTGKEQVSKENAELHKVAGAFSALAAHDSPGYGTVAASFRCHNLTCEWNSDAREEFEDNEGIAQEPPDLTDEFKAACEALARYLYHMLETEWEYQNSDEVIAETIEANEYTFTEDGARYG